MILLSALMATASPTMDARSEKVIDLFVRVCLEGEARFARGDVERVNPGSFPGPLVSVTWARVGVVVSSAGCSHTMKLYQVLPSASVRSRTGPSGVPVGVGAGWAAGTPALGRLRADDLLALADVSDELSGGEIRITPWRSVLLPTSHPEAARRLDQLGMCTDLLDPVQSVIACAGSTGCASGGADTQAHGRTLIDLLRRLPAAQRPASVHLSGCTKGCAGTAVSAITFIATDPASDPSAAADTYDMYRNSSVQRPGPLPPRRIGVDAALAIASSPVASLPAGAAGA